MPRSLSFISNFEGNLGIPIHARGFAGALKKQLDNLNLFQINGTGKLNPQWPGLIFWYPNSFGEYNVFEKNMGLFVFEYTKIPKLFIEEINKLDLICTPSEWAKKILIENGVTVPAHVIPGGVDHSIFNSKRRNPDNKVFRFLHVGKAEERKGTKLVIRSFNEAFRGDKNIRLTLSIDNPHIPNFSAEHYLSEMKLELKWPIDNIDVVHNTKHMIDLYNAHHVAVFPTRAEGIGLPIVEAMSAGMPVIVSNNTGITEYANFQNAILLNDLEKMQVYDEYFFPRIGEFGFWMTPTIKEIMEKMILCYNNYESIKRVGEVAEAYMRDNYSWDLSAKKFVEECLNEN